MAKDIEDELVPTGTGRPIKRRDVNPITRGLLGWGTKPRLPPDQQKLWDYHSAHPDENPKAKLPPGEKRGGRIKRRAGGSVDGDKSKRRMDRACK